MFKIRQGPTLGVGLIENSDDQRRMGKAYTLSKWVSTYHCSKPSYLFLLLPVIVWRIQNLNYVYEAQ